MKRMLGGWVVPAAVVLVLAASAPVEAKNGLYVGGSLGRTSLEITGLDLDIEEFDYKADSTTFKVFAGYRFLGFFAVEGSYVDFGSLSDSINTVEGRIGVSTDLKGFDACAMGMLPLGIADLFVKGGFVSWDADIRTAVHDIVEHDSDSGTDMVYGIGAQVRFAGLAVRGELEYFDIADADSVYLISVGASFTF